MGSGQGTNVLLPFSPFPLHVGFRSRIETVTAGNGRNCGGWRGVCFYTIENKGKKPMKKNKDFFPGPQLAETMECKGLRRTACLIS
jgi:hypothetical protein